MTHGKPDQAIRVQHMEDASEKLSMRNDLTVEYEREDHITTDQDIMNEIDDKTSDQESQKSHEAVLCQFSASDLLERVTQRDTVPQPVENSITDNQDNTLPTTFWFNFRHQCVLCWHHRQRLIIAMGCALAQNMTVATPVLYFAHDLLKVANIENPNIAGILIGTVKVGARLMNYSNSCFHSFSESCSLFVPLIASAGECFFSGGLH